ncbi:MAG: hypothetical protein KBT36_18035 [Kurthia sp.]|uniref:hypothetical protein n=2 Tax=Moraxellaceae TaxID=468 RepID=UPI0007D0AA31|nr:MULTISPECIES: hypothetical protein [Acinetobacter]MBQ0141166.1 hypothetical protein [Candidatus Kurthia equi]OAL85839.1 hypothetical protein AY605_14680 [Acinetobacter sp. SFD]PJI36523.1 hypothetical protein CU318_03070 [Acinetobacter pseudolwoffii]
MYIIENRTFSINCINNGLRILLLTFFCTACLNAENSEKQSVNNVKSEYGIAKIYGKKGEMTLVSSPQGGVLVEHFNLASKNNLLGILQNDIIYSIDSIKISTPEELMKVVRKNSDNAQHVLKIKRSGSVIQIVTNVKDWSDFKTPKPPEPPSTHNRNPNPPTPPKPD